MHRLGHTRRTLTRRLALLTIGALAIAACGGDDDATTASTAPAGTEIASAATTDAPAPTATPDTPDATDASATDDTDAPATDDSTKTATDADAPTAEDGFMDPAALAGANRDGTLRVAWHLNLATLDPILNANVQNVAYNYLVYDALIYRTPDGELLPGLAESWEWADDGSTFTVKIRSGVPFHDGSTLDAGVVKQNIDRLIATPTSPVFGGVRNVASVDAPDASTVVFNMKQPDATLPYSLADRAGMIVSGKAISDGADLGTTAIGAGPYKVVEFRAGDGITFERFDDYWGDPNAAAAKRVDLVGVADGQARANGVVTGEYDAAYVTASQVNQVKDAGVPIAAKSNLLYIQTYLNRSRPFFSDFRVSQAMSYAIDRQAICDVIYQGFCEPTFKPFPNDYWAGSPDIADDYYTYDPEKAKELLAAAGYADGFAFELMIPAGSDPYPQFAELLQAQWAAVGITVNINPVDISQLADTYFGQKQSDALLGGGGQVPEPAQLFQGSYMTTSYANPGGVTAPGMDDLVNQMLAALDQDDRAALVRDATKLVVDNALNEILVRPEVIYGVNDNVLNWQPNRVANYPIIRGVGVTD